MMRTGNRAMGLALTALAVAGAVALTPPAASADPVASDVVCTFNGVANFTPPIPAPPAGIEQDGMFTFSGGATCVALDEGVIGPFQINIVANGGYSNLSGTNLDIAADGCIWASPDPTGEIGLTPCPPPPVNPANQAALTNYMVLSTCGSTGNMRLAFGVDVSGPAQIGGGACGPAIEAGQVAPDAYNLVGAVSGVPIPPPIPPISSVTIGGGLVLETA